MQPQEDVLRVVITTKESLVVACAQISANRTGLSSHTCGVLLCADITMCAETGRHTNRVQTTVTERLCNEFCRSSLLDPFYKLIMVTRPPTCGQLGVGGEAVATAWYEQCLQAMEQKAGLLTKWKQRAAVLQGRQMRIEVDVVISDPEFMTSTQSTSLAAFGMAGWMADRMQEIVLSKVKPEDVHCEVTVQSFGHGLLRGVDREDEEEATKDFFSCEEERTCSAESNEGLLWVGENIHKSEGMPICTRTATQHSERVVVYAKARDTFGGVGISYEHLHKASACYARVLVKTVTRLGLDLHCSDVGEGFKAMRTALHEAAPQNASRLGKHIARYLPKFVNPRQILEVVAKASHVTAQEHIATKIPTGKERSSAVLYRVCGAGECAILAQRSLTTTVSSILQLWEATECALCHAGAPVSLDAVIETVEWFYARERENELATSMQKSHGVQERERSFASTMMRIMREEGELLSKQNVTAQVVAYERWKRGRGKGEAGTM